LTHVDHPSGEAFELEVQELSKSFGSFKALDAVDFKLRKGSFHALLGENGAGKSTLVKCVMGYYQPDEGRVVVRGQLQTLRSPRQAHALSLGMVYQHFMLVPQMSVLENLVLSQDYVPAKIDWQLEHKKAGAFFKSLPFSVPLELPAQDLSAGQKQKVEIARQLYLGRTLLILDEPTSVLTPGEADETLGYLKHRAEQNNLSVIMITHKFREVTAFADEVTILRKGQVVGSGLVADLSIDDMATLMMGRHELPKAQRQTQILGDTKLKLEALCVPSNRGTAAVTEVSLEVRSGEIVGVAGVSGNGQRELVEVLSGQRQASGGRVLVNSKPYHATSHEMQQQQFRLLPEEPLNTACVKTMSVAENMLLRRFQDAPFSWRGFVRRSAMREAAKDLIHRYKVKTTSPDAPIQTLSGGNVQRAAILVAANPCFGLDFSATAEIRSQLLEARNNGAAVLLISEDLDELLELADRIVVMSEGQLVYEVATAEANRLTLGHYMAGGQHEQQAA
jgi:general nucleoside transport system ATP-binding protein